VAMMPHERSLVERLKDKPFNLIGVNSDKEKETYYTGVKEKSLSWRSFWCGPKGTSGPIPTQWNVRGWPTLYVIDHNGVIRHKWVGSPVNDKLDEAIDALVAEAQKATTEKAPKKGD
jgi:hypothetical protein